MKDLRKTKAQLVEEIEVLRQELTSTRRDLESQRPVDQGTEKSLEECIDVTECQRVTALMQRYEFIVNTVEDMMSVVSRDHHYQAVNNAWCSLMGINQENSLGKSVAEIWGTSVYQRDIEPRLVRCFAGEVVSYSEWLDLPRKGRRLCEAVFYPYSAGSEGITHAVIVTRDVTEQKQDAEVLQRYEFIVNTVQEAMTIIDRDGCYQAVNDAWCAMMGLTRGEVIGKTTSQVWGDVYDREISPLLQRCFNGETIQFGKWFNLPTKGRRFSEATFYPYSSDHKTITNVVIVTDDTTERRKAEEELQKLSLAIEASPASVVITDLNGIIEYVNPKFLEVTGYTLEEVMDRNSRVFHSGEQSEEFYGEMWNTITNGHEWHGEFSNRKKNGELYWERVSISPMRNAEGEITHFVSVKEDVTEEKRIAEELRQAKEAAEAASRAKSAFLANMSHEIRTPMNAILGFSQLMFRDPELTLRQRQRLDTINRSGEHLLALISDILEMSKIEAGRTTLNPSSFDLHALINDLAMMFRVRTDAKKLGLPVKWMEDVPRYVRTDQGKLRQVLINLLGNAVKFTEKGSIELRISALREVPLPVEVATQEYLHPLRHLVVEVEDTGPGMFEEELSQLFQSFQQTSAGARVQGGTGLGLAISREFARLMGGDITVRSEVGKGSTFRLMIELEEVTREAMEVKTRRHNVVGLQSGQPKYRVLIVDDEEETRLLLAQMLSGVGFETSEAPNGEEAVLAFERWQPHLILMDLRMPVMDGYEACRLIRAKNDGEKIPIIAVTASAFEENRQAVLASGINAFLSKPFRAAELFEKIGQQLAVQFVYANETIPEDQTSRTDPAGSFIKDAIANLPIELVIQMHEAITKADLDRLLEFIEQVKSRDPDLARELSDLANNFQYDTLIALLQK